MKNADTGFPGLAAVLVLACSIPIPASRGQELPEIDAARETTLVERIWAGSIPDAGLSNATIFGVILESGRLRFHGFSFNPMSGVDDCRLVGDAHRARIEGLLSEGAPSYCKLRGTWRPERVEGRRSRRYRFEIESCLWVRSREEIARLHRTQKQLHLEILAKFAGADQVEFEQLIQRCRGLEEEWPSDDGRLLLIADALRRDPPDAVPESAYVTFLEDVIAQRHLYLGGPAGEVARNLFWKRVQALSDGTRDLLENRLCESDVRSWCPYKSRKITPGRKPLSIEAEGAMRLAEVLSQFGGQRSRTAIQGWRRELIQDGDAYAGYKSEGLAHMDACLQRIRSREGGTRER